MVKKMHSNEKRKRDGGGDYIKKVKKEKYYKIP
jgi:hypothetical protein